MRIVGLVLVVVGALALGYEGLVDATGDGRIGVSPVASAIALVLGLLMLAAGGRREDG